MSEYSISEAKLPELEDGGYRYVLWRNREDRAMLVTEIVETPRCWDVGERRRWVKSYFSGFLGENDFYDIWVKRRILD